MARTCILPISAIVLICATVSSAQAQLGGYYRGRGDNPIGPTVSPYLNLLQSDTLGGVTNYQSLVKPLIDQGNAINRQGNTLNRIQQQINSPTGGYRGAAGSRGTGHTTFFMNYSHFYAQPR